VITKEAAMTWFVILAGAHWRDVSPEVFQEHSRVKEWSQLFCHSFEASGSMAEIQKRDSTILVPHASVIAAVKISDRKRAAGFVAATDEDDESVSPCSQAGILPRK